MDLSDCGKTFYGLSKYGLLKITFGKQMFR